MTDEFSFLSTSSARVDQLQARATCFALQAGGRGTDMKQPDNAQRQNYA